MVQSGSLSAGHARALLPLTGSRDAIAVANEAVARQYSVREVESRVRALQSAPAAQAQTKKPAAPKPGGTSPTAKVIEDQLRRHLQTDVKLKLTANDRGFVEVAFYSAEDLDRLMDLILGADRDPL
jgi:ParB family chromosome partitioning protein